MRKKLTVVMLALCLILVVKPDVFAFIGGGNKAETVAEESVIVNESSSVPGKSETSDEEKQAEVEAAERLSQLEKEEEERIKAEKEAEAARAAEEAAATESEEEAEEEEVKEDNPYAELIGKATIAANYVDEAAYNVQLAVDYHQNVVIPAGGSYNAFSVLGDGGADKGFQAAVGLLSDGSTELLYGSGICPVTTAVYQAGRDAGLTILEVHDHVGAASSYAAEGDQAMFNYPTSNLKMRNDYDYPVSLYISYSGSAIYAEWYLEKTGEDTEDTGEENL